MKKITLLLSLTLLIGTLAHAQREQYPLAQACLDLKSELGVGFAGITPSGTPCLVKFSCNSHSAKISVSPGASTNTKFLYDITDSSDPSFIRNHYIFRLSERKSGSETLSYSDCNDVANSGFSVERSLSGIRVFFTSSGGKGPWNDYGVSCRKQ